jgi:hypothetical protein
LCHLAKGNKNVDESMEYLRSREMITKEEHAFMHEARIRREVILNNMIHWGL